MGKSDVKLHRFLSVPSNVALCGGNEFSTVMAIDKDITLKPCDTDKILVRQKSVIFQMKSSLSSGTDDEKLPEGLYLPLCASDINSGCIKASKTLTCNTSVSEMVRNDTMLRDARNRRTALGYIFQDTNLEDLDNLLSGYDNRTNSEVTGNMPENDNHRHRRPALADIFQDFDEDDLEHLLSLCEETDGQSDQENDFNEVTNSQRRLALPDIFANISEDQLTTFVENCRHDIERMESVEVNEVEMPRRCRRFAKGNIFSDVNEEDKRRISSTHERDINNEERTDQSGPSGRRFALGNIFSDVSEEDLLRIVSVIGTETDDEDELENVEEKSDGRSSVSDRRFALVDIFQDVDEDEITKVLSNICAD